MLQDTTLGRTMKVLGFWCPLVIGLIGLRNTIFAKKIFTHVLTIISSYNGLIFKKSVTKLKPLKFASDLRKLQLSNLICSKVIKL